MTETLVCWQCGATLEGLPLPLGRLEFCRACRAELHVCRMCRFYDTGVARHCREPVAEDVQDKTRANFCGYFQPRPDAWQPKAGDGGARSALEDLFGLGGGSTRGSPDDADGARSALEDLFRGDDSGKR